MPPLEFDKLTESTTLAEFMRNRTTRLCAEDAVFKSGFEAEKREDCPYELPKTISDARRTLSCKPTLTDEDKRALKALGDEWDATPYARWVSGFYSKKYVLDSE